MYIFIYLTNINNYLVIDVTTETPNRKTGKTFKTGQCSTHFRLASLRTTVLSACLERIEQTQSISIRQLYAVLV